MITSDNKILVVLDQNYKNYKTDEELNDFKEIISTALEEEGYNVDFDIIEAFIEDYGYDVDVLNIMNNVDKKSAKLIVDDYICVIAEGFAAWFYMQAKYNIPVLCINPIINPIDEYGEFISDDLENVIENLYTTRGFNIDDSMCVLSDEHYDNVKYFDNVFKSNTVVRSEEDILSEEFWNTNGDIIKALEYIKDNY